MTTASHNSGSCHTHLQNIRKVPSSPSCAGNWGKTLSHCLTSLGVPEALLSFTGLSSLERPDLGPGRGPGAEMEVKQSASSVMGPPEGGQVNH